MCTQICIDWLHNQKFGEHCLTESTTNEAF